MGYYMRYITTDSCRITMDTIARALKNADERYALAVADFDSMSGELLLAERVCGVVEINYPGDGIFDEDIADLRELVSGELSASSQRVLDTLASAKAIVAVEATWKETDSEATLEKIDPLWRWLFERYAGLLQADNDGFYDRDGLILPLDLKI